MKKIICLVFAFFAMASTINAQTISMIGDGVSGWGTDVDMTTSDNVHYTLSGFTFANGGAKFRVAHDWGLNYGASTFPSGTGTANGANIPTSAGVYDVTFNLTTKAYQFTAVAQGFADISVYGTGNSNVDGVMSTTDGVHYNLYNYDLGLGDLVFRQDLANTNTWGSASFPSGTATSGGTAISATPGTYNISFNLTTGDYTFSFATISIIGDGLAGWSTDTDMVTDDGVNYSMNLTAFHAGSIKFRQDHGWAFNWGANTFPSGTATLNGNNINTVASSFVVAFNRVTGAFSFSNSYPKISLNNGSSDIDMVTADGVTYTLNNFAFTTGSYKFRQGNADVFVWGASTFPSGTAETYITSSIPVPGKSYNVTFNKSTGAYTFSYVTISIIGSATAGGWDSDTTMSTTNGINYTLTGTTLTSGAVKFRQGYDWATNWGSNSFPQGTGTNGGSDIPVNEGSTYNIAFNMQTGIYTFTDLMKSKVRDNQCGTQLTTLDQAIKAVIIPNAQMYRFEVANGGTSRTIENSSPVFSLTQLTGSTYGSLYNVRVGVKLNGAWRTYGTSCDIYSPTINTSASVPVTKMRASQCGTTLATIGSPIHSEIVYGAEAYRFQVTNGATVTEVESPIYYFFLTDSALGTYGTTFSVKTAAKVAGTWGNYGTSCSISTPALISNTVPTTKLAPAFCGATLAALNTKISASTVYNAQGYRFEITKGGVVTVYDSALYNFRLSDAGIVATSGSTYAIRVAAKVNGVYGIYGTSCNVTMPGSSSSSRQIVENTDFSLVAYPNPSNSAFKLQINGSNSETVSVLVFDMMGRQIENKVVNATDIENISLGQNYSTGVYNVIVSQGMNTKTVRLVKN
jgi:hypothetical protein